MRRHHHPPFISDVCLLLRAHGEQRWLNHEVVPVLGELQQSGCIPEEQLGAALAYLEVLWAEASHRAAQTDAAHADLQALDAGGQWTLSGMARRYHAAVCDMRSSLARHVDEQLAVPEESPGHGRAGAGDGPDPIRFRAWRRASISSPTQRTRTAPWHQPR
jgi:hypothetical protein